MSHRINSKSLRLGISTSYSSKWFTRSSKRYRSFILQEFYVRFVLQKFFPQNIDIQISRRPNSSAIVTTILLNLDRKKFIQLKSRALTPHDSSSSTESVLQSNLNQLSAHFSLLFPKNSFVLKVQNFDLTNWTFAKGLWVQLAAILKNADSKNKIEFKKILISAEKLLFLKRHTFQGFRVGLSGRSSSSGIARHRWIQSGSVPRQSIRTNVDYFAAPVPTRIGLIGIQIWIHVA